MKPKAKFRRGWHRAAGIATALMWGAAGAQSWGVRTLPGPDGGWTVRWMGEGEITVDGRPLGRRRGPITLDGASAHEIAVDDHQWRVAPWRRDPCDRARLVALGDGRADRSGVGPSAGWRGLLGEALRHQPDLVLNTGDLVKKGDDPQEWRQWLLSLPPWPPIVAVKGNHDRGGLYERLGYAADPVTVWSWGPAQIIGINTEAEIEEIARDLEAALRSPVDQWRIVITHRPIWSRGPHGSDERGDNRILVPLLDRYGVDVVLSGHDHDYERLCRSVGVGAARRCDPDGTLYVITGGAATFTAPLPGLSFKVDPEIAEADEAASRVFSGSHHYLTLDLSPDALTLTAHRALTGNVRPPGVIDQITLRRESRCPR